MKRISLILICFVSLLSAYAITPSPAIINLAKNEVETAQYYLPTSTGMGLTVTEVWYNPDTYTIGYKYVFDIPVPRPTDDAISETKQGMIHMLRANPNSKDFSFISSGITFLYNYYNPDGTFLYSIGITPSDINF